MPASPNLIADAVVTAIRGLDLVPADRVMRLKTPSLPAGAPVPVIAVVVGEAGAEGMTEATEHAQKLNRYPTTVVIITAAAGRSLKDDETLREWRDAIEDQIDDRARETFANVPGFNLVNTTGQAPFDGSVLNKDLSYSSQVFNVEILERRAGVVVSADVVTTYTRPDGTGGIREKISGPTFAPITGGFRVAAAELGGLVPRPDDELTTPDSAAYRVTAVAPSGENYDLTCEAVTP